MKIGLIARADNSGLGTQTYSFYRHMNPDKTMVVDIEHLNGNKNYPDRYQGDGIIRVKGFPDHNDIDFFLDGLDVVFIAESAYNPYVFERSKQLGVKTAVQYNYEFFDWFNASPQFMPDMLIAPSRWHYLEVQEFCELNNIKHIYLHCPVDRDVLEFRYIEKAKKFLHTAGKPAAHDRNGTKTVIQASKLIKSDVEIVIHFQGEQGLAHQLTHTTEDYINYAYENGDMDKLTISVQEYDNYQDVYKEGDVMLLPRRYGGNCLPLNEALGVGMPVIMTDVMPNSHLLPPEWLIKAERIGEFTPRTTIDIYSGDPVELAEKIDHFAGLNDEEMNMYSELASAISDQISWETMKPMYIKAFEELCQK